MIERRALGWAILCLLQLSACGGGETSANDTATVKLPQPNALAERPQVGLKSAEVARSNAAAETRLERLASAEPRKVANSRYTSLEPDSCKLIEEKTDQSNHWRRRCAGSAGYAIEMTGSDLKHDVVIIGPDERSSELKLSSLVTKGASNSLGDVVKWRGLSPRRPQSLIVRVNVPAKSESNRPKVSDLVVVRLNPSPCAVAVIRRVPHQNEKARAVADGKLPNCLPRSPDT